VTAREAEVLALVGRHLTNAQIAAELFISVRTVEAHVAALLRKMEVSDRRTLARRAAVERAQGRGVLPVPATPFVGRVAERAALGRALGGHRLVTAVGPGGIGKSRLAISVADEVAAQRRDGVWFVDLVRVTDPAAVVAAVAEAVGVSEQRASSPESALVASLARRDGLLVLDNCEHLLDGVRDCVDRIVAGCPGVTVLATSRTRLMLPYECLYPVSGLSVDGGRGGDAVELFRSRVSEATGDEVPDTLRVSALCQALDGMPLAIELAASRYATLGLDGLEAGLHERLRFFTVGSSTAGRHRSLHDTIAWSYDLLGPAEQALLRGVAMFASWFDLDAAHIVVAPDSSRAAVADGLARLADHSLLVVDRGEPTRYRALETIRQYGEELLAEAGELPAVQARHEAWCRAVLTELAAVQPDDAWCARFDRAVDDARAALVRCAADRDRSSDAAQLAAQLAGQLWLRGRLTEAQRRYEQASTLAPTAAERADHLRLAAGAAATRYVGNDAIKLLRAAADTATENGDRGGAALDLAWMSIYIERFPGIMADKPTPDKAASLTDEAQATSDGSARPQAAIALSWTMLSNTAAQPYDERNGAAVLESARHAIDLAHRAGDATLESAALDWLTAVHIALDDIPEAVRVVRRRAELIRSLPVVASNGLELVDIHRMASDVYLAAGDLVAAGESADAVTRLPFLRGEDHVALGRGLKVDAIAGHFDDVVRGGERFRVGWERAGRPAASDLARSAHAVAMVHGMLGDDERRAEWLRITTAALGIAPEQLAGCATGWAPTFDALLALHRDESAAALERLSADLDDQRVWGFWNTGFWRPWYSALWAEAAVLAHTADALDRIRRARRATRDNPIATAIVERAAALAAGDRARVERLASVFAALASPYQHARTETLARQLV
jgi:predicted ATPase/DNA-binding CsgD family transcriptional regulator